MNVDYHTRSGFKHIVHPEFRSSKVQTGQLLVKSGQVLNAMESKSVAICRVSAQVV